jgi:hypothetical protein
MTRRLCVIVVVLAVALAQVAGAATTTTVTARANREGVILESPKTNPQGLSEWAPVCSLPCEGLRLELSPAYRVAGEKVIPSDPFKLLPTGDPQLLEVRAKTTADVGASRGLFIGGLAVLGVGLGLSIPGAVLASQDCGTGHPTCPVVTGAVLFGTGLILLIIGTILTANGASGLASNSTVNLSVEPTAVVR